MKLFYTSPIPNTYQNSREMSLGGYKSLSQVQDMANGLFQEISLYTEEKNIPEYIGLVLFNDTGSLVDNIELWFEYPVDILGNQTNIAKLEVSGVILSTTGQMEKTSNNQSKPSNSRFYEADGENNAVGLGSLGNNKGIGLWLKRSLIVDRILAKKNNDVLNINFKANIEPIILEDIKLKINWVDGYYGGSGLGVDNL